MCNLGIDTFVINEYIDKNKERIIQELSELLRFKSIGADMEYADETQKCAEWLKKHLQNIGLQNAKLIATNGKPLVYGEWSGAGVDKATVLIYGHYDVQSPDPLDEWETSPFQPSVREGHIFARGATDNKGQFFCHLKAIEYLLKSEGKLPVNVKVLLEGEEESGGRSLENYLREYKDEIDVDLALVSDGHAVSEEVPGIEYGLRGIVYFEVTAEGPKTDLHSGLYGGGVANPASALMQLVSRMQEAETGKILIPGFYDDVVDVDSSERELLLKSDFQLEDFQKQTGAKGDWGDSKYSLLERLVARPTMDVHGLLSGYTGEGPKTVIPRMARVKVSFRLVGHQEPKRIEDLVRKFVEGFKISGVKFQVKTLGCGSSVLISRDHEFIRITSRVLKDVWGREPLFIRSGGSIPIVATMSELGILPLVIGYGLIDDRLHSPNERMKLSMFYKGIRTTCELLRQLGK